MKTQLSTKGLFEFSEKLLQDLKKMRSVPLVFGLLGPMLVFKGISQPCGI